MRLGLGEAIEGRKRARSTCPACGRSDARPSRRRYEGLWALLIPLRAMKCPACGAYFPVSPRAPWTPQADPNLHHLPFQPSEIDPAPPWEGLDSARGSAGASKSGRKCPRCGSGTVSSARPGPQEGIIARLTVLDLFRCAHCNASFSRVNAARALFFGLLLASLLAGLTYAGIAVLSSNLSKKPEPRIKRGQLPPVAPPVLR